MTKVLFIVGAALLASQSVALAQSASGQVDRNAYVAIYGANASAAPYREPFRRDVNSTRSLLEGTASGLGSGPFEGSPNGN